MVSLGTPLSAHATKVLLLGSGELGKEVVIELQRLGVETVAVDRYTDAPAMQVAHRSHVIDMQDAEALRALLLEERPDLVVPEIEAIATSVLADLEQDGFRIIPTARAAVLTMNREGIRRLAAEELGLPTSPYAFVDTVDELAKAADELGWPVVVKPVMSSSGHGQSLVHGPGEVSAAWDFAQSGGRGTQKRHAASWRDSSPSTPRSRCSPCRIAAAPCSAIRCSTGRSPATTPSRGRSRPEPPIPGSTPRNASRQR
jgi:phosphoribosylglycinamide formyltransferase 2